MKIEKAKPIKLTNVKDNTTTYGIRIMINEKWMGLLDGEDNHMVEFSTRKEAKQYCKDLFNEELIN